uniref:Transmembrane protein n=1 Tax=Tupiella akineta TaxID=160070 RepID=Q3ZJ71_TUPAK|nr:hypothetical protein PsakCp023 [Tupiella akineta]AAV80620.1 hypothetical protein [Tupiella akineta]
MSKVLKNLQKNSTNVLSQQKNITTFNENNLGFYLAGLIEKDGGFSKTDLRITFHLKDRINAENLQKAIGFGQVYRRKNQAVTRNSSIKEGLQRVLHLTNGRFVGPFKINQLKKHNSKKKNNMIKISKTFNSPTIPNKNSPFLSITNASLDRETFSTEFQDAEVVEMRLPISNRIWTLSCAPPLPEITLRYNSYDFWSSPLANGLIYAGWALFVYGGIAIFNKLQTGRFFQKPLTEIKILSAYQKQELSLKQATFLLTRNFDMLFEEAEQFLKDDFSEVPNKESNKQ